MVADKAHRSRPRSLTGAAGEYYVAAELSLLGWLATVTIKNAPGTDVLARSLESGRVLAVQTKTKSGGNFTLTAGDELPTDSDNEWYALVELPEKSLQSQRPTFYLVPRNVVAALIFTQHNEWLATPGRRGQRHRDNARRVIRPSDVQGYREKWELLHRQTSKVPLGLDKEVIAIARGYGPSDRHRRWPSRLRGEGKLWPAGRAPGAPAPPQAT
jgi:hypothetical protein